LIEAVFADLRTLKATAPEWSALCARAAEPNPFAEPGFLLPLIAYEAPKPLRFVLARREGKLVGVFALILPRVGLAEIWMSSYAGLPAAVIDRDETSGVLAALLALLRRTWLTGLIWPFVPTFGPLEAHLKTRTVRILARHLRPALRVRGAAAFEASLPRKRRAQWARLGRRLARAGKVVASSDGSEAFFAVEQAGWKGARGTALADEPERLAFARAALEAFARDNRLVCLTLSLEGAPVAAGLVLVAGARGFFWKAAYHEGYALASPGVQMTLALTKRLSERPGLQWVDSCAGPDNPMIGRVWADSLEFEDLAITLRRGVRFWLALALAYKHAREEFKRFILWFRAWALDERTTRSFLRPAPEDERA